MNDNPGLQVSLEKFNLMRQAIENVNHRMAGNRKDRRAMGKSVRFQAKHGGPSLPPEAAVLLAKIVEDMQEAKQ
jgi:hypothetical protein